jgi:hypothetical protein
LTLSETRNWQQWLIGPRVTCSHICTIATLFSAQELIGSKVVGPGRISQDLERVGQREFANQPFLPVREAEAMWMTIATAWCCSLRLHPYRAVTPELLNDAPDCTAQGVVAVMGVDHPRYPSQ